MARTQLPPNKITNFNFIVVHKVYLSSTATVGVRRVRVREYGQPHSRSRNLKTFIGQVPSGLFVVENVADHMPEVTCG